MMALYCSGDNCVLGVYADSGGNGGLARLVLLSGP